MYIYWSFLLATVVEIFLKKWQVLCQDAASGKGGLPFQGDNGSLQLILRAYTENLIKELEDMDPGSSEFTKEQTRFIRNRMRDLYEHILNHPALYQRYLWVGRGKPTTNPDEIDSSKESWTPSSFEMDSSSKTKKATTRYYKEKIGVYTNRRRGLVLPSEEICKTDRRWERLNVTHDFYENEVEIVHENVQQFVFTYRCVAERGACIGISPLYDSECTERYGWIYMFYRKKNAPQSPPQWGYVATPHHCACKITPRNLK